MVVGRLFLSTALNFYHRISNLTTDKNSKGTVPSPVKNIPVSSCILRLQICDISYGRGFRGRGGGERSPD